MAWLLPAALVLLFGFWTGTFPGGATAGGAVAGQLAVLGALAFAASSFDDPLRLGGWRRLVPQLLVVTAFMAMLMSPVPRAGRVAALLLPAFLMVPAAVERALGRRDRRDGALLALAVVAGMIAAASLVWQLVQGSARAAMPLGHHNLLAGFLVTLLPATLLPIRQGGAPRLIAVLCAAAAIAAIVRSGSLLGMTALAVEAGLALLWWRRFHKLLLPCALLVLALQMPRAVAIFRGEDPSTLARLVYLDAGWRGLSARPWLGWGPGSTPWTISQFLRPRPGVNPPSEVVGDLHSLPMQVLYELGGLGFLFTLGTAAVFLRQRIAERDQAEDPDLLAAGLIGMLGAATTRMGGAALSVAALPLAAAVAAGIALAARPRREDAAPRWPALAYGAVALLALVPLDIAHAFYGRAAAASRRGDAAATRANAESAANWDPSFPLYGARAAWLMGEHDMARKAAALAVASPPLWLEAGAMRATAQLPAAATALQRACSLDPLGAPAPMHLAISQAETDPGFAARAAARALLAEPRYLAARFWIGRESLRAATLAEVERWPGIDLGWKASLLELANAITPSMNAPAARLGLDLDLEPALSFSLYAFRRDAWPATLAPIDVDAVAARRITIPPASTLSTTKPDAFAANC